MITKFPSSFLSRRTQRGFTLVELMIATVVLLVGVVAVMQLVPAAMQSNLRNRYDTSAVVMAQRLLDEMLSQPLDNASFVDPVTGNTINLGSTAQTNIGGPVIFQLRQARINFNANNPGPNCCAFFYQDPNSASREAYEVRWAVITTVSGGIIVSKRFLVGAWRRDPTNTQPSVTVEGMRFR